MGLGTREAQARSPLCHLLDSTSAGLRDSPRLVIVVGEISILISTQSELWGVRVK